MCNLLPHLYFWAQLETYFSPKAFLQNSAASALVIRNVSPWKRPLGKIPLSSASMWLNIRDNLVRFLLQRTTEIVSFRKKKSLAFWAKQNQRLLQFKNDPSMHNSFGALFEVFPQHSEHPKHGNYQQGVCLSRHFPQTLYNLYKVDSQKSSHGRTQSQKMCKTSAQTSPIEYWTQNLISLGFENSFWEHIKLLLPQTMEAERLSRSPEVPNTIDVLRECQTDHSRPKPPRECKTTCRFFLKW